MVEIFNQIDFGYWPEADGHWPGQLGQGLEPQIRRIPEGSLLPWIWLESDG